MESWSLILYLLKDLSYSASNVFISETEQEVFANFFIVLVKDGKCEFISSNACIYTVDGYTWVLCYIITGQKWTFFVYHLIHLIPKSKTLELLPKRVFFSVVVFVLFLSFYWA